MAEYIITEQGQIDIDSVIAQTTSIKDLLTFDFNDDSDNIARNKRILELLYLKVCEIEKRVTSLGR